MDQLNIFGELYPTYKIKKPIRLIELFAGYGSQALALKYLGVDFEHWKIAEWCIKSFNAYKRLHMTTDNTDYSKDKSKEWLIEFLAAKGISKDWNKPMTAEQIKKLPEHQLKAIYNDIQATHNLVNVQQISASDLEINNDGYCYIMTYSFPCQDLSLAGLRKGMAKGEETRSGMLWEVERILKECKALGKLPDVLLMENVPQVHGVENYPHFESWMLELEKLGYSNYYQDLIATDYGIPQIRNRTFMVSILGEWFYEFPKPIPLKLKLKDMLEDNVDDKYYLSEKGFRYVTNEKRISVGYTQVDGDLAVTLTAKAQNNWTGDFISDPIGLAMNDSGKEIMHTTENAYAIKAHYQSGLSRFGPDTAVGIPIKNATKKGYLEATDGDGIDISSRMETHRGTVQKGLAQTVTCLGGENLGVVVANNESRGG